MEESYLERRQRLEKRLGRTFDEGERKIIEADIEEAIVYSPEYFEGFVKGYEEGYKDAQQGKQKRENFNELFDF